MIREEMHSLIKDNALTLDLVMVETVKEKANSSKKDGMLKNNDIRHPHLVLMWLALFLASFNWVQISRAIS